MCNPAEMLYPRDARLGFHTTKTQSGDWPGPNSALQRAPELIVANAV
jgi:hypothetical protein